MNTVKGSVKILGMVLAMLFFTGCETFKPDSVLRSTGFYYLGWKVSTEVIEHDLDNLEAVQGVGEILTVLQKGDIEELLFSSVETWYKEMRPKLQLPEVEKRMLEELFIFPFWEKMKMKYGGDRLNLTNPQVRKDLASFSEGVQASLSMYQDS